VILRELLSNIVHSENLFLEQALNYSSLFCCEDWIWFHDGLLQRFLCKKGDHFALDYSAIIPVSRILRRRQCAVCELTITA
jgi:hypothetical protein